MYDTKDLGPAPVISNLCRQLKIRETINRIVTWDPKQCLLDPGLLVVSLIINLLCRRNPLCLVEELCGRNYRFMVVYSSHLDGRTLRGLNRRLEKQKTALQNAIKKIMKLTFSCENDAKDALARFLKDHDQAFYPLKSEVAKTTEKLKRNKRGRPAHNETLNYRDLYRLVADAEDKGLASCFSPAARFLNCFGQTGTLENQVNTLGISEAGNLSVQVFLPGI